MVFQKVLPKKGEFGFTVIELIIVVFIAGVMLMVAAPTISSWVQKNRLNSVARKIVNDLHFSRQQAISKNKFYIIDFESTLPIQYTIKFGQTLGTYTDFQTVNLSESNEFVTFTVSGDPVFNDRGMSNSQVTLTMSNVNNDVRTIVITLGGKISLS